jgi:hypothetical protein
MQAIRIRTKLESTTLAIAELNPFLGKQVEIIVLEEEATRPLLVTGGLLAKGDVMSGDPVADALAELRSERARSLDKTTDEIAAG